MSSVSALFPFDVTVFQTYIHQVNPAHKHKTPHSFRDTGSMITIHHLIGLMVPWLKGYSEPYGNLHYAFRFINDYSSRLQGPVRWRP